jgi:hypothetical protein
MKRSRRFLFIGMVVILVASVLVMPAAAAPVAGATVNRELATVQFEGDFASADVHLSIDAHFRGQFVENAKVTNVVIFMDTRIVLTRLSTGALLSDSMQETMQRYTLLNDQLRQYTLRYSVSYTTPDGMEIYEEVRILANYEVVVDHIWVNGEKLF